MATQTTYYSWNKPAIGGDEDAWGAFLNGNWDSLSTLLGGVTNTQFQILNGATCSTAELNKLAGLNASTAQLNYNVVTTLGTSEASKVVTSDASGNIKVSEEVQAKAYLETVVALSAAASVALDLSTANVFTLTTDQATTFVFDYSNIQLTTNDAFAFTLRVLNGGAHNLIWPSSVKWAGATAPDAPASGEYNTYVFYTIDGGVRWDGAQAVDAGA